MLAHFDIIFGTGISRVGDILDLAADIDVVNKSGSWYAYQGNKLAQGREQTKSYLLVNPELLGEIEAKVRLYYNLQLVDA